ncbi:hypothetical protein GUITHDRAFT_143966 [Guillardia theta CCMP2712]|uniref:Uncharacterized protein n=1 Tax=Guillardia theta (strain CCMP2712) TaxID=905079 RepID=L1IRT4_GUITC|nr:hypothetical protein GUITHDRAFT_143966 [Guillardia theta CCMP2712]EKX38772.1 hypothetical protein GUITHDRAFT_143966 [Guillardia theta CCMP2712]|eukprot:XP_005825752.1 hypothetical protein GUITHDRAFT_143966 [Guillardia theta CCMP2712]
MLVTALILNPSGPSLSLPKSMSLRQAGTSLGLRMAIDPQEVEKFMDKAENGKVKPKKRTPLATAMNKRSKALAIGMECCTGVEGLRDGQCCAIWIDLQPEGRDLECLEAFGKEQQTAAGEFPGPVCVIRGGVSSLKEIAEAKAAGAGAVAFAAGDLSEEEAGKLSRYAQVLDMEAVAIVSQEDDAKIAAACNCEVVIAEAYDAESAQQILKSLPESQVRIARVNYRRETEEDCFELTKQLHSSGYTGVIVSGVCNGVPEDLEQALYVIGQMTSKRSSQVNLRLLGADRLPGAPVSREPSPAPSSPAPAGVSTSAPKKTGGKTKVGMDTFGLDEFMFVNLLLLEFISSDGDGKDGYDDDYDDEDERKGMLKWTEQGGGEEETVTGERQDESEVQEEKEQEEKETAVSTVQPE